jgi:hypothetical protein
MHDVIEMVGASFILFTIFVGIASPLIVLVICLFYYLKKRLDHKQIMAAIEKGTPLSDLRPVKRPAKGTVEQKGPRWIKSIVVGIALIFISLPFLVTFLEALIRRGYVDDDLVPFGILFGIGFAFFVRGLLLRKTWRQSPPSDQTDTGKGKTQACVTKAETTQQLGPGAESQD